MWLQAIYQGTFGGHLRASLSQRGPVEAVTGRQHLF